MKVHLIILFLLSLSPLSTIRALRKPLTTIYPLIVGAAFLMDKTGDVQVVGKFGVHLKMSEDSRIFALAVSISFLMVALRKRDWSAKEAALFLTSILTISATFISYDLFNIYVLMEVLSVQAGLMAIGKKDEKVLWNTLKYLIVGSIGASLYLVGVVMVYQKTGSFSIPSNLNKLSMAFITTGILMRAGVFGLGTWLLSFHSSVSDELSALFSGSFIGGVVFPAHRILGGSHQLVYVFQTLAVLGSLLVFSSKNYKRILASSTMAHLGAMLSIPDPSVYFLNHAVAKTYLFLKSKGFKDGALSKPDIILSYISVASLAGFPFTLGALAESQSHSTLLMLSGLISSAGIFSALSRVKSSAEKFKISSIFPIILIFPFFSFKSFLTLFSILGMMLKIRREKKLFLEKIEWNVTLGLIFLAGVILFC